MEAIRIFLAFATYMNFKVFQMDVKSAFLNGKLKEEVYVKQPPGFESSEFPKTSLSGEELTILCLSTYRRRFSINMALMMSFCM
ncbi:retrovirus-related pol polyprotein from transposon TNT 1-94 [Tanacetum coccineum]